MEFVKKIPESAHDCAIFPHKFSKMCSLGISVINGYVMIGLDHFPKDFHDGRDFLKICSLRIFLLNGSFITEFDHFPRDFHEGRNFLENVH